MNPSIPPGSGKVSWRKVYELDPKEDLSPQDFKHLMGGVSPHFYWRPPRNNDKLIDAALEEFIQHPGFTTPLNNSGRISPLT